MATSKTVKKWVSNSVNETVQIGKELARLIQPGTAIGLIGDLGSGKTTLVKGLALGFGIKKKEEVKSPTFVIFHIYRGRIPIYHFDLYRLNNVSETAELGMEEYLEDAEGVSLVEWVDRVPELEKDIKVMIRLARTGETTRSIQAEFLK